MVETTAKLLVYHVHEGPEYWTEEGDDYWAVKASVSADGGASLVYMLFNFDDEELAEKFKKQVNNSMEPIEIGDEEQDEPSEV